ncbi:MAG: CBS domain-containing protein [Acidobacteria bacterium]|nr:CBS domain-containing protein [Acidobacteriota bacterium]
MEYRRRDDESYENRYDSNDRESRPRHDFTPTRQRNFADQTRAYPRDFPDRADAYANPDYSNYERRDSRNYVMEYPDRWSGDEGRADREEFQRQGARRSHLRCRDIMSRRVTTCKQTTPITEIAKLMRYEDVGAIPVLGENGTLEGIVTDRDIVVRGLTKPEDDAVIKAQDCMSDDLFTANQNDRVVDVIRDMGDHQVRRVPVVDSRNRLVGILSMADLATQTNKDQELEATLRDISMPSSWFGRMAYYLGF